MNLHFIADILPPLTVFSNILILFFISLLGLLHHPVTKKSPYVVQIGFFFRDNALRFAWVVSAVATMGSLFYSEVMGYTPCLLCWYQRILMYPFSIILGIAFLTKDNKVVKYVLPLSSGGALLALYHYVLQVSPKGSILVPCSTVGYAQACSDSFTQSYGFVTIPWMSFSAFVLITLLFLFLVIRKK